MALTSRDFITKNGIVIEGNSAVTSSTNQSNAFQANGGAAIAKNLVVGTTSTFYGPILGGSGVLRVDSPTVFSDTVTFSGTSTYVYSTNTVYTDNLIEIHAPNSSPTWLVDDGKDVGIRFRYYNAGDKNAALVLANDSKWLEWYNTGAEGTSTFSGGTYGTFKTGSIVLADTTPNLGNTTSGALQVSGGVGIAGDLYVGGTVNGNVTNARTATTSTNLAGGATGSIPYQSTSGVTTFLPIGTSTFVLTSNGTTPYWTSAAGTTVGSADNLSGGTEGALPFQSGTGTTMFDVVNLRYNSSTHALFIGGSYVVNTTSFIAGVDISISVDAGTSLQTVTINNTSTLQTVTDRGFTTTNRIQVLNTTSASSTNSGALQIVGGVGIGEKLYVGDYAYVKGAEVLTSATVNNYANQTTIYSGTDTAVSTNTGVITVWNTSTLQSVTNRGATTNNAIRVTNTTDASSTDSGALQVVGGVGIGGKLYVGGDAYVKGAEVLTSATVNTFASKTYIYAGTDTAVNTATGSVTIWNTSTLQTVTDRGFTTTNRIHITNTTNASSTDSGALQVVGGVGIGGKLYVGDNAYVKGAEVLTSATVNSFASQTYIYAGTDTAVNTSTGAVTVWNTSTLQTVTSRGAITDAAVTITNASASTSSVVDNALYVAGGVGIGGSLYVTGDAVFESSVTFVGTSTYVYSTNTVYADNILELHNPGTGVGGLNNQWFVNDGKDIGIRFHYYDTQDRNAFLGRANDTGYLEWYNRGAEGANTFTGATYGTFKTGGLIVADLTTASNLTSGALQVAGGASVAGTLYVNDLFVLGTSNVSSTGTVNIGNATATTIIISSTATIGALDVEGNVLFQSGLRITTSTNSTSTITGAVVVTGGVGIGKDVHIGGTITVGLPNDGVSVPAINSNNVQLASYTSNVITGSSPVNLDQWSSTVYRTARYTAQVVDGNNVHVSEIVVFHNGTNAYLNEYGVTTSNGELGTFSATYIGGYVIMSFTPVSATAMTIKLARTTITL